MLADESMTSTSAAAVAERVMQGRERILAELHKVIVGQDEVLDLVLTALFTGGHCLITGVPGLAKTLLIKTLAAVLHLTFKRIQFTPDLMPADITGTEVLEETDGHRTLRFVKGPVFAQIILADEINRTPPKTQSALLEAMQEYHVTAAGRTYELERPFLVLATQNPIELEGTYPLPEAQLSRFMFNIVMTYLSEDDEVQVVTSTTSNESPVPDRILDGHDILEFQRLVRQVVVSDEVARYAVRLVDASRPGRANTPRVRRAVGQVGRRAPRVPGADLGWQGACTDARSVSRVARGRARARPAHATPPHRDQFLRRVRGRGHREGDRAAARGGARAAERHVSMVAVPRANELRYLDPAVIARMGSMELRARTIVEGFLIGLHRSPYNGFSVEFSEYRQYMPGDDLELVARLEALRADRPVLRQEVRGGEQPRLSSAAGCLGVDLGYGSADVSKQEYGAYLAASLAYLMNRQRDAVGLMLFAEQVLTIYMRAASARPGHLRRLLLALDRVESGRGSNLSKPLNRLADALSRRGMVVLISDLLEPTPDVAWWCRHRVSRHLRFRGSDVIVFHLLDPAELTFPFDRATRFQDLETDDEVMAVPSTVREFYLKEMQDLIAYYERELRLAGMDYCLVDTSKPLDLALLSYLGKRSRLY